MYLLFEWEGRTGKYVAQGHGVWTEHSKVRALWPRPYLTQSIGILSYEHSTFPFFLFLFFFG